MTVKRACGPGIVEGVVRTHFSEPQGVATLSIFDRENDPKLVDMVIRGIETEGVDHAVQEQRLVDRALELMPFHGDEVERIPVKTPSWDDDHLLEDHAHNDLRTVVAFLFIHPSPDFGIAFADPSK